ncbi:MAG: hypothetical protein ACQEVA_04210 [Myxococcota bacterium]
MIALACLALTLAACDNDGGGNNTSQDASDVAEDVVEDSASDTVAMDTGDEDAEDAGTDTSDSGDTVADTAADTRDGADTGDGPIEVAYDFANGAEGWTAGVADYSPNQSDTIDFRSGIEPLPDEVADNEETGFLLSGKNVSDDLAMFLTRQLGPADGIEAGRTYEVTYHLGFASDAPSNCVGIGGAPGESVYLKAGAAGIEPMAVEQDGDIRMNVDKGNQSSGGPNASVVGHIANGIPCEDAIDQGYPYVSLERDHTHTEAIRADDQGRLWLLVLTDSGFEGETAIYYQRIAATLEAQ